MCSGKEKRTTTRSILGVHLDDILTMDDNAKQSVRTCFFHMRQIRQPRRFVDENTMYALVRALILSRLDYSNSLYAGCTISTLHRLQRVQDAAARLLCGASRVLMFVLSCSSFTGCLSPVIFNTNYVC